MEKYRVLCIGSHRIIESKCFEHMQVFIYLYDLLWVLIIENFLIKTQLFCISYLIVKFVQVLTFITMYFGSCHNYP